MNARAPMGDVGLTVRDYKQAANKLAGPGRGRQVLTVAKALHAAEPTRLHVDSDDTYPCPYCWLRAGRAVRAMAESP